MNIEDKNEFSANEIDRIVISKETKRVKIVLENGKRILIDYENIKYID